MYHKTAIYLKFTIVRPTPVREKKNRAWIVQSRLPENSTSLRRQKDIQRNIFLFEEAVVGQFSITNHFDDSHDRAGGCPRDRRLPAACDLGTVGQKWVTIQSELYPDDCGFVWLSGTGGDGTSLQDGGGGWMTKDNDRCFCINGATIPVDLMGFSID